MLAAGSWQLAADMKRLLTAFFVFTSVALLAQAQGGLDPAAILKPLADEWVTYAGDYSGRRYSALTQINQTTVKNLGLAWISRGFVQGAGPTGRGAGAAGGGGAGGGRGGGGAEVPMTVAGLGSGD
jgi:alcohol dehydrogenase (cytochrome c)